MTESKVVRYKEDGLNVEITVARANGRRGMLRTILQQEAFAEEDAKALPEGAGLEESQLAQGDRYLHTVIYPSCIAVTVKQKGFKTWPVPFDEFAELPEPLLMEWEEAAFELNQHWFKKVRSEEETEAAKKKVLNTTSD